MSQLEQEVAPSDRIPSSPHRGALEGPGCLPVDSMRLIEIATGASQVEAKAKLVAALQAEALEHAEASGEQARRAQEALYTERAIRPEGMDSWHLAEPFSLLGKGPAHAATTAAAIAAAASSRPAVAAAATEGETASAAGRRHGAIADSRCRETVMDYNAVMAAGAAGDRSPAKHSPAQRTSHAVAESGVQPACSPGPAQVRPRCDAADDDVWWSPSLSACHRSSSTVRSAQLGSTTTAAAATSAAMSRWTAEWDLEAGPEARGVVTSEQSARLDAAAKAALGEVQATERLASALAAAHALDLTPPLSPSLPTHARHDHLIYPPAAPTDDAPGGAMSPPLHSPGRSRALRDSLPWSEKMPLSSTSPPSEAWPPSGSMAGMCRGIIGATTPVWLREASALLPASIAEGGARVASMDEASYAISRPRAYEPPEDLTTDLAASAPPASSQCKSACNLAARGVTGGAAVSSDADSDAHRTLDSPIRRDAPSRASPPAVSPNSSTSAARSPPAKAAVAKPSPLVSSRSPPAKAANVRPSPPMSSRSPPAKAAPVRPSPPASGRSPPAKAAATTTPHGKSPLRPGIHQPRQGSSAASPVKAAGGMPSPARHASSRPEDVIPRASPPARSAPAAEGLGALRERYAQARRSAQPSSRRSLALPETVSMSVDDSSHGNGEVLDDLGCNEVSMSNTDSASGLSPEHDASLGASRLSSFPTS